MSGDPNVEAECEMTDAKYQLAGLLGFAISGLIFLTSGVRAGDTLTVVGSAVWIVACGIWAVPFLRPGASPGVGNERIPPRKD
jgi:membrane protein DedA with SNARE-associated domain